ncbi:MAG: glycosyltransferase [Bryobacteraceae bacterium]
MRILHAIESMDPAFGGTVECVAQLAAALSARHRWQNEILSLDAPGAAVRSVPGVPLHAAGPPRTFYRYCRSLVPWLRGNLGRFDAVIIHGLWRHHSAAVARECRHQGVPYYVVVHSMLNPWFETIGRFKHFRKTLYWRVVEHETLSGARAVLFTSEEERRLAREAFRPYECREAVLPLGTAAPPDSSPEAMLAAYPQLRGKRLILFLGRLHPMKACDNLIAGFATALRSRPEFTLVMAGPDSTGWRGQLEQLAGARGVADRVVFTGPLFGDLKWSALRAAELFALPSHCEAFPYAVLEALGSSLPVLVTDKVNIYPYLRDPECALIVDDTEAATAGALTQWARLTDAERRAMADNARLCFERHFHVDRTADLWHDFLGTSKPRRILHCIESIDPAFGGPVQAVANLVAEFEAQGVESDVLSLDAPDDHQVDSIPVSHSKKFGPAIARYRYCSHLREWLSEHLQDYDATIVHGLWRHHSAALWSVARQKHVPYYVYPHSMLDPWFNTTGTFRRIQKTLVWKLVEHRVLRDAARVLMFTDWEQQRARQSFAPYECRETIAPLGTADPPIVSAEAFFVRFPKLRGRRLLLFLGRLHPVKGCDLLLRAFAGLAGRFPAAHLVIAGPDAYGLGGALQQYAHAARIESRVTFTGPLFDDAKWSALRAAELLVLPSHSEGLSYSVLEALGSSLPVVITDKVASHTIIAGEQAGLVATDEAGAIEARLVQWLELDPTERERYRNRARECFVRHFHRAHGAKRLLEILREDLAFR